MSYKHLSGAQKRRKKKDADFLSAATDPKQQKLTFVKTVHAPSTSSQGSKGVTEAGNGNSEPLASKDRNEDNSKGQMNLMEITSAEDLESTETNNLQPTTIKESESDSNEDSDSEAADHKTLQYFRVTEQDLNVVDVAYFVPPDNMPNNVKVAFVNNHPIQPVGAGFNPETIYYRTLQNGQKIQRKWLSFNKLNNCMYCAVCMAFATSRDTSWIRGNTLNLKHIHKSIEIHKNSINHKMAVDSYMNSCSGKSLDTYFNNQRTKQILERREVLRRIINIVLVLAKQDLPFRAHRNESIYALNDMTSKKGNFLAIVKLVSKYDPVLKGYIDSKVKKSLLLEQKSKKTDIHERKGKGRGSFITLLSKNTFNKIIIITGNLMQKKIASEVKEAKQFSLEIDSTQDVSAMDQLAVCVRYINNGVVQERLLKLLDLESSTGIEQYKLVKEHLSELSIDLKDLVSESFDGAANMSGKYAGLQAHLKKDSPNSIFTHCHAHVLNLVICDASNNCIPSQNLFSLCQKVSVFMSRSYKRANLWKNVLKDSQGNEKLRKLKKIGDTRWNSKDDALQAIFHSVTENNEKRDRFVFLLEVLHSIGYDGIADGDSATEARILLEKFTQFETILTAFMYLHIFSKATPVSRYLQTKGLDYIAAWNHIVSLKESFEHMSRNFDQICKQAEQFTEIVQKRLDHLPNINIETSLPEKINRKKKKMPGELADDELSTLDPVKRFRVTVFRPTFDKLSSMMESRFFKNENIFRSLAFFDPNRFDDIKKKVLRLEGENEKLFNTFCTKAGNDASYVKEELLSFASCFNSLAKSLDGEFSTAEEEDLDFCESEQSGDENMKSDVSGLQEKHSSDSKKNLQCKKCLACVLKVLFTYNLHTAAYTKLYMMYKYILTLACTQVQCERIFSKLKIIKNRLRASMSQELLEPLILISTERDKVPSTEEILEEFSMSSTELKKYLVI